MKAVVSSPKRTVDLRAINRQSVLRCLYFSGPMSRQELSNRTTLSAATITNVIADLLRDEFVFESGQVESDGGRPRTILAVNSRYGCFVGVDVGETHIQLDLFDLTLQRQRTVRQMAVPQQMTPDEYADQISAGLNELVPPGDPVSGSILGMGIGLPGVVERGEEQQVSSPLWNWRSVPFGDMLKARIPLPIHLDNGAKAMTLAETWFGAGRGKKDIITVLVGTGIGSGIVSGGELFRGPTNSAGEFGHTLILLNGRRCRCGNWGCLEAYAGAPGIITTLREIAPHSPLLETNRSRDQVSIIDNIVRGAAEHNPEALQTLQLTTNYLAASFTNLVNLFNPELIVLGGWVGLQIGQAILPALRESLNRHALPLSRSATQIEMSQLGQTAVCMGAACLPLEQFLSGKTSSRHKRKVKA
ncbi:MAG: ROK family transcriptional regulator [Anaerolineae bacterium]|nr:ROK family transcriptional regulator [Anaerolineae bacterium]